MKRCEITMLLAPIPDALGLACETPAETAVRAYTKTIKFVLLYNPIHEKESQV